MVMRLYNLALSFLLLTITFSSHGRTTLELVEVEAVGTAETLQEAINSAVSEAVGKINGKRIDAQNLISRESRRSSEGGNRKYSSSSKMNRNFEDSTRGIVDSYVVISESRNKRGLFEVKVKAKIAKVKLSKSADRLKIAILPFSSEDANFADSFLDSTIANLVSTRRFTVLDRQNMVDIAGERSIAEINDLLSISDLAALGNTLLADYIVVGKIKDVSYQMNDVYFPTIKRSFNIPEGKANISYKVIDISTSQVKFSDAKTFGFDQSSFEKLIGSGMRPDPYNMMAQIASSRISNKIIESIYPIIVVGYDRGVITLNQGGNLVDKGAIYGLYQRGKKIIDPYTKESLGRTEKQVGKLKVEQVTAKMSSATLIEGVPSIFDDLKVGKFLCRLEKASDARALEKKKIKEKIKKKKEQFNDDW